MTETHAMPAMPPRIAKLPRTRIMGMAAAPVPWFVTYFKGGEPCAYGEGEPDFRVADTRKLGLAIRAGLCWVCGEKLGAYKAFLIGPMCAVNRVTSEPPNHSECAIFSAQACPFLTRPHMRRNKSELPEETKNPAGIFVERNPGCACVWVTKTFNVFRPHAGGDGILLRLGDPTSVLWFAEGKQATREQVLASIDSGYPLLEREAREDTDPAAAVKALARERERAMQYLPAL